jgi:ATP-dependent Clp protease ATP-binding subunit ClpC
MLNHQHIGVEHILLALCHAKEVGDVGLLAAMPDVRLDDARERVVAAEPVGTTAPGGHLPFTPNAKLVLEKSTRTATSLGHRHIDSGHLLLAMFEVPDDMTTGLLADLAIDRATVLAALTEPRQSDPRPRENSLVERIEGLEEQVRKLTDEVAELRARLDNG